MDFLRSYYRQHPLRLILFTGFFFRLLAAVFSRGYGMHDDHFLIIEAGGSIADGFDYNKWLPWNNNNTPGGHNWFYTGLHILLFKLMHFTGPDDPQSKMLIVRLLHAMYSKLVIFWGYHLSRRISNQATALRIAWLLALLWMIPNLSVRNLIEWVCVPPLLLGSLMMVRSEQENKPSLLFVAGAAMAIAAGIRYQAVFFFGGAGLYLLWRRDITGGFRLLFSFAIIFSLTQSADYFLYGRPFAEMEEYFRYNEANATSYFDRPWYQYILTVGGLLVPPVSLFFIAGYVKSFRRLLIISLPSLAFFVFHSYFPNKQERFILPFIPYLIIAGMIGWEMLQPRFRWKKFEAGSWKFFYAVNGIAMVFLCFIYTKRSAVAAMDYLYSVPDDNGYVIEMSHTENPKLLPQFYSGRWDKFYRIYYSYTASDFAGEMESLPPDQYPRYIIFYQQNDIWKRIATFKRATGKELQFVYLAEPGWFDRLLYAMNPRNKNEPAYLFRVVS